MTQTQADSTSRPARRSGESFDFSQNIRITLGGGISSEPRKNSAANFENDSVAYIDFWMLDPFDSTFIDSVYWFMIENIPEDVTLLLPLLNTVAGSDDTLKKERPFVVPGYATSPCNYLEGRYVYLQNGTTIRYTCWKGILTATNEAGKEIWTKKPDQFSDSFVKGISYSGNKDYDVLIEMIDGARYLLKSKSGKVKPFERSWRK